MATLEEEYKNYQQTQGTDQINSMYDAQKQAQLAGLESAYNQNLSNAQAARDALPGQYQARANDLAVQYERQRRNLNQQAAANGLNTGAGSQMQLALGGNYNRDYGAVRTAQQQALDTADRDINDLKAAYQSQVQQAVANNDYQRAQALLAEYKNQYQRQLQQAQTLASYGDFSAYLNVPGYSQEQIDNMRNTWIASNPQLAYNTGAITAEQYYNMTGQWPAGYSAPSTGGWGGGGTGSGRRSRGGSGGAGADGAEGLREELYDPRFNPTFTDVTRSWKPAAGSPGTEIRPTTAKPWTAREVNMMASDLARTSYAGEARQKLETYLASPQFKLLNDAQKELLANTYLNNSAVKAQSAKGK